VIKCSMCSIHAHAGWHEAHVSGKFASNKGSLSTNTEYFLGDFRVQLSSGMPHPHWIPEQHCLEMTQLEQRPSCKLFTYAVMSQRRIVWGLYPSSHEMSLMIL
jgi:hypothetical protein